MLSAGRPLLEFWVCPIVLLQRYIRELVPDEKIIVRNAEAAW